jgi:SpoVK/Ycf46/Vps4 family AAA+-type ATPase
MKKETKNSVMMGLAVSALTGALNPVIKSVTDTISSHMMYTVDISSAEFYMSEGIKKYFKDIPDKLFIEIGSDVNDDGITYNYKKNIGAWERSCENCTNTIFWNNIPITFKLSVNENKNNDPSNKITLSTINTPAAKKKLRQFMKVLAKVQHEHDIKNECGSTMLLAETNHGSGLVQRYLTNFKRRTFENTFIPSEQEMLIKESIDTFKSKREWYLKNSIPYHFGFLLYGKGGTGKSSIAQAIAEYANAQLISFPGDRISELPKMMGGMISSVSIDKNAYRVILIEDIDCGFAEKAIDTEYDEESGKFKSGERKVGLASILNALDGMGAPTNAIYVFTTNHIEKLDPALIRPGRCDVKLEIPPVTRETFIKFIKYHYGKDCVLDKTILSQMEFNSDVTFAELQTYVMKGATIADLCNIIERK